MISPNTPPGTKIVCIDVSIIILNGQWISEPTGLVLHSEYTVRRVEPIIWTDSVLEKTVGDLFVVILEELRLEGAGRDAGHLCQRFRRRDLPESLVRLQTALLRPAPALG